MERRTDLLDGATKRFLHVAPEPGLFKRFCKLPLLKYITADLASPSAQVRIDLTALPFSDGTFDGIYCSHVLEHVQDDHSAIRELRRVCSKSGWAILQVPITADETFEDPEITDPEQRLKVFGQHDHVRRYGPDYVGRLSAGGFNTKRILAQEFLSPEECSQMAIKEDSVLFFCRPS